MAMTLESSHHQGAALHIDYTPGTAVAAGEIVSLGGLIGFADSDIAANALGAMAISGVRKVKKDGTSGPTFAVGAQVEWDDTGKLAVAATGGDFDIGCCVYAAGASDDFVTVWANQLALQ
jgi:predicted RecA/RadA family phage recombinase